MDAKVRHHIGSNIVGYVALFVALCGVPAAFAIGANTIGSKQLKANAVKNSDLADNSVGSPEVIDNSLTGSDVNEGTLGQVPSAQSATSADSAQTAQTAESAQSAQTAGTAQSAQTAGNADTLDNLNSTDFLASGATAGGDLAGPLSSLQIAGDAVGTNEVAGDSLTGADINEGTLAAVLRFGATIPSGTTVRGNFGCTAVNTGGTAECRDSVSFPLPAPSQPTSVNFAPGAAGEDDATCTGTISVPTAPAGKVCIYENGDLGTSALGNTASIPTGFLVSKTGTGGQALTDGSWAYTAP
jgi:hypothetical protein